MCFQKMDIRVCFDDRMKINIKKIKHFYIYNIFNSGKEKKRMYRADE